MGGHDLCTLIDRRKHNRLKWGHFEVFIIVNFIKDIESYDSLRLGQEVTLKKVADVAADFEPLIAAKFVVKLL